MTPLQAAGALWLAWFVSWMLASAWSTRTIARQPLQDRFRHVVLVMIGVYLLFGYSRIAWLRQPLVRLPGWAAWAAVAVIPVGFAYAWWARLHIGRLWSGQVTLKEGHTIVRSGPYSLTRHPIYTGLLLSAAAMVVVLNQVQSLAGFAVTLAGFVVKYRQEEALLIGHFGDAYLRYREEVPALIPWLL